MRRRALALSLPRLRAVEATATGTAAASRTVGGRKGDGKPGRGSTTSGGSLRAVPVCGGVLVLFVSSSFCCQDDSDKSVEVAGSGEQGSGGGEDGVL